MQLTAPVRPARRPLRRLIGAVARDVGSNRPLLGVLCLAVLVRAAVAVAYDPAVFTPDSWSYLQGAIDGHPLRDRPMGYSALLAALAAPGVSLLFITTVQHVAGLVTAAAVGWYLTRKGLGRWAVAAAVAIVALDGYAISLEQQVMPEAFFTLVLVAGLVLAAETRGWMGLGASGLLLGTAVTIRSVAIFVVPVWLLYVFFAVRPGWRPSAVALGGLAVPLLALSLAHLHAFGTPSLNPSSGWFMYGRVGEIAHCDQIRLAADERGLCSRPAPAEPHRGARFYLWDRRSPANQRFGPLESAPFPESSRVLGRFARSVVRQRPLAYAGVVAGDFLRYFDPRSPAELAHEYYAPTLPSRPMREQPFFFEDLRDRLVPGYEPRNSFPHATARWYVDVLHTSRLLAGVLTAVALAALVLATFRFRRVRPGERSDAHGAQIALFTGAALAMLLGSAATSEFIVRYLVPCMPLLVVGGLLGAWSLARRRTAVA